MFSVNVHIYIRISVNMHILPRLKDAYTVVAAWKFLRDRDYIIITYLTLQMELWYRTSEIDLFENKKKNYDLHLNECLRYNSPRAP